MLSRGRWVIAPVSLALALAFAGCGGNEQASSTAEKPATGTTAPVAQPPATTAPGQPAQPPAAAAPDTDAEPLLAWADAEPEEGAAPLTVQFTADTEGGTAPLTYQWKFGDGTESSEANPKHTYEKAGSYRADLEVKDSGGDEDSDFIEVEVSGAGGKSDAAK
jgi:PKD repeat protein